MIGTYGIGGDKYPFVVTSIKSNRELTISGGKVLTLRKNERWIEKGKKMTEPGYYNFWSTFLKMTEFDN